MKIKKFVAPSMPEAMKKIREELGSDAVILNSKIVHSKGFFGLFAKKNIEVIAAIDPNQDLVTEQTIKSKPNVPLPKNVTNAATSRKNEQTVSENKNIENEKVLKEISELKSLINKLEGNSTASQTVYPETLQKIAVQLKNQEIDDEIVSNVMDNLVEKWFSAATKPDEHEVVVWTKEALKSKISHVTYGEVTYKKKYVNVIGPTGVGKTTTLAKMAANAVLRDKKKAAFITTDTYRIAAIDQLKTYAKILCIPLEVCYTAEDFKKALEKFSNYEVVFIDTAGRNFRNEQYVLDLKEMIRFNEKMETFLVLALTAKQTDMEEIYKQFSKITIDKLIFTKSDETANYGAIINMITNKNIGVAYLTNGQDVPDDIVPATVDAIINIIFGE